MLVDLLRLLQRSCVCGLSLPARLLKKRILSVRLSYLSAQGRQASQRQCEYDDEQRNDDGEDGFCHGFSGDNLRKYTFFAPETRKCVLLHIMGKRIFLSLLVASAAVFSLMGQENTLSQQALSDLKTKTTFGGYAIGQAKFTSQDVDAHSNFSLRLVRFYVDGKVLDFAYKLQAQANGNAQDDNGNNPRIVDAWIEWQRYGFLRVKFGQFKRAFTFENPMNPWDIGATGYSQLATKLAGFNDRVGEHSSNGRDVGVQLQGDLLPVGTHRRNLLHYQVGIYNGQGINHSDQNSHKDIIGGIILTPLHGLQIGAFGWEGDYVSDGLTVDRRRFAFGVKYDGPFMLRAEYATSQGRKIGTDADGNACITGADRADAWYALVGKCVGNHWKLYAKYDVYRDTRQWASTKSLYCLTADYYFTKNLKIQANYVYTHDRAAVADYHTLDLQMYVRF